MNAELEFARTMNTDSKKEVTMTGTIGDKSISAAVTVDRIAPSLDGRFSYAPGMLVVVAALHNNILITENINNITTHINHLRMCTHFHESFMHVPVRYPFENHSRTDWCEI